MDTAVEAGEPRTWTDVTGAKVEAVYVSATDKAVTLRRANLQNVTVPLDKLSGDDQKFVEDQRSEEKEANSLKVNVKGDIVWRLDDPYRSILVFPEQKGEIWTWNEEEKVKGEKLATVKVKYIYQSSYARNDVEGFYETDEAVKIPKDAKLVFVSILKIEMDGKPITKEDVSVPMNLPQADGQVIKLPTARASAR